MKKIVQRAREEGKKKKYWAYMLFRHVTSPGFLQNINDKVMAAKNTSQEVDFLIKQYTGIFYMFINAADYSSICDIIMQNVDPVLIQMKVPLSLAKEKKQLTLLLCRRHTRCPLIRI
jgi:hypothetical protein